VPKFLVNADGTLTARNDLVCFSIEHKLGIHGSPTAIMSFGAAKASLPMNQPPATVPNN